MPPAPATEIMSLALGKLTAFIIYLLEYPSPPLQPAHVFANRVFQFSAEEKMLFSQAACSPAMNRIGRKCKLSGPFLQTHGIFKSDADINKN